MKETGAEKLIPSVLTKYEKRAQHSFLLERRIDVPCVPRYTYGNDYDVVR